MFVATCFGFLAVLHVAASSDQNPPVTDCSGSESPGFDITSLTVKGAKLGKKIKFVGTIAVNRVIGKSPVLQISFSTPDGRELPCIDSIFPCELNTCNGTTRMEKEMNKDWDNKCPVQPGTYTARLEFRLPSDEAARDYFGDGNVVVKFNVVDEGTVLGCGSAPITIDVD